MDVLNAVRRLGKTEFTTEEAYIGCRSAHIIGNAEIPTAKKLSDIMWSQAQLADPAFKKITAPAYHDANWAAFTRALRVEAYRAQG